MYGILMIILNDDIVDLIERLEAGIDKGLMQGNWEEMMEIAPILSGNGGGEGHHVHEGEV